MQIADGSVVEAIIYIAKEFIIQELVLEDIKFAVINKPNTNNLLGQNVFNRFKSYEIKNPDFHARSIYDLLREEHMTNLDMPEQIGSLVFAKRKKFGRSTMSYYKPKEN
jgi:hypothetical protein